MAVAQDSVMIEWRDYQRQKETSRCDDYYVNCDDDLMAVYRCQNCQNLTSICGLCTCMLSHVSRVWVFVSPMNCSLPGSSVHGVLQAKTVEGVAISFSRWSSWPRGQTHTSCVSCIADGIFTYWATWEAHIQPIIGQLHLNKTVTMGTIT